MPILPLFLDIIAVLGDTNGDKNLEIIILRQPVRIYQRKVKPPSRISDPERIILVTLIDKFGHSIKDARHLSWLHSSIEFLRYYFWINEIFLCILNGRKICILHPSRDLVIMRGEFLPMLVKPCFPIYFYRIQQYLNSQMFDSNVLGLH